MSDIPNKKIAMLIDGDNAQAKLFEAILNEAGKHGKVTVRRIYGDWTASNMSSWKEVINSFSIRPMQKFAFASGKNSTDTAMIIDAMDILHAKTVSGFCIVSSDSDYTGLVQRIKEEGLTVIGIGDGKKTAKAFVNACDVFVFTENITASTHAPVVEVVKPVSTKTISTPHNKVQPKTTTKLPVSKITNEPIDVEKLENAWKMIADEEGWAYIAEMGLAVRKIDPSFDFRTYNAQTFTQLFKKLENYFELQGRTNANGSISTFVRYKQP